MKIKAIVLDLDGTLLGAVNSAENSLIASQKMILPETKTKLIELQKQGVKIILASGRPDGGIKEFAQELQLDQYDGVYISFNGAKAVDVASRATIFNQPLKVQQAKAILEHIKQFKVIPMVTDPNDQYLVVNDVYDNEIRFGDIKYNAIKIESRNLHYLLQESFDLAKYVDYDLNKILLAGDADYLAKHYQEIYAPFKDEVNAMFTTPFYYEFTAKNVDKTAALKAVLKQLKIEQSEVMAFGDGENDLSMLEYAQIGVAMENAVEILKKSANFVTKSNDDNGIVFALEHYQELF